LDTPQQSEVPETTIPATPEVSIKGVVALFVPTIMKCALGGYIVSVPDKGISAFTTLEEAMDFLSSESHSHMGEEMRLHRPPRIIERKSDFEDVEDNSNWYIRLLRFWGVRI
jgi:hypothetical protein